MARTMTESSLSDDAGALHVRSSEGLFASARRLLATFIETIHTRLELLRTELQEEVHWAAKILIWAAVCVLASAMTLLLGALAIVFWFWDSYREAAALSVTGFFLLLSLGAAAVLMGKLRHHPQALTHTVEELKEDVSKLRGVHEYSR
jgi:uncharacterized membrane protein YqjE